MRDGDCVFDVGANIGMFTVFVQERFRDVKVFAFEPSPKIFPLLQANTAKYGDKVSALAYGLSNETKQAVFTHYPSYSLLSGFHGDEERDLKTMSSGILSQWRETYPGEIDPSERILDALARRALGAKEESRRRLRAVYEVIKETGVAEVSLLKIDAEGCELEILSGLGTGDWTKVRQIAMEIHDADGSRMPKIKALLQGHGFDCTFEQEDSLKAAGMFNGYARRP